MIVAILAICGALCTPEQASTYGQAAAVAGLQHGVPLELMLGMAETESRFQVEPDEPAGGIGERGPWQLNPRQPWGHRAHRLCQLYPGAPCAQAEAYEAAKLLRAGYDRCGTWTGALTSYNHRGGPCYDSAYAGRVLRAADRWKKRLGKDGGETP